MENMSKINLYRKLGMELSKHGANFLRKSIPINKTQISKKTLERIIKETTGVPAITHDSRFNVGEWNKWETIIKYDWTDYKDYVSEIYDCDNFADTFGARMAEIYALNTAGRYSCELVDPETNKHIGYHRANIILALTDEGFEVFLFEPMNDKYVKIKEDEAPIIGNWKYVPRLISFN